MDAVSVAKFIPIITLVPKVIELIITVRKTLKAKKAGKVAPIEDADPNAKELKGLIKEKETGNITSNEDAKPSDKGLEGFIEEKKAEKVVLTKDAKSNDQQLEEFVL